MLDNCKTAGGYLASLGFATVSLNSILDCSMTILAVTGAVFGCAGALITLILQYRRLRRDLENDKSGETPKNNDDGSK